MTIDQMKALKQEYGLSYEMISKRTGIPLSTVSKVLTGATKAPRRNTVKQLTEYFQTLLPEDVAEAVMMQSIQRDAPGNIVTYAERDSFPEERRTELIDGVLYDMASPSVFHQELCFQIAQQLRECIRKEKRNCRALMAPADVVIQETDPATVLQPDVFVICDKEKVRGKQGRLGPGTRYYGGPELVIEVLSPSTRRKDAGLKLAKYIDAGVGEFWVVDPDSRKVIVYNLDAYRDTDKHAELLYLYGFDQRVPVRISEGRCEIDFASIVKDIEDFYR